MNKFISMCFISVLFASSALQAQNAADQWCYIDDDFAPSVSALKVTPSFRNNYFPDSMNYSESRLAVKSILEMWSMSTRARVQHFVSQTVDYSSFDDNNPSNSVWALDTQHPTCNAGAGFADCVSGDCFIAFCPYYTNRSIPAPDEDDPYMWQKIFSHEFGHSRGLGHISNVNNATLPHPTASNCNDVNGQYSIWNTDGADGEVMSTEHENIQAAWPQLGEITGLREYHYQAPVTGLAEQRGTFLAEFGQSLGSTNYKEPSFRKSGVNGAGQAAAYPTVYQPRISCVDFMNGNQRDCAAVTSTAGGDLRVHFYKYSTASKRLEADGIRQFNFPIDRWFQPDIAVNNDMSKVWISVQSRYTRGELWILEYDVVNDTLSQHDTQLRTVFPPRLDYSAVYDSPVFLVGIEVRSPAPIQPANGFKRPEYMIGRFVKNASPPYQNLDDSSPLAQRFKQARWSGTGDIDCGAKQGSGVGMKEDCVAVFPDRNEGLYGGDVGSNFTHANRQWVTSSLRIENTVDATSPTLQGSTTFETDLRRGREKKLVSIAGVAVTSAGIVYSASTEDRRGSSASDNHHNSRIVLTAHGSNFSIDHIDKISAKSRAYLNDAERCPDQVFDGEVFEGVSTVGGNSIAECVDCGSTIVGMAMGKPLQSEGTSLCF